MVRNTTQKRDALRIAEITLLALLLLVSPTQGVTVSGTITNSDTNQPVSGVSVVLFDLAAKQVYSTQTNIIGAYSKEVQASVYDINIVPPANSGLTGKHELNVEIDQNVTKDYALSQGFAISGVVTRDDTNQPVANVFVGVLNPDTQQDYGSLTDGTGKYTFSVPSGRYEFHASSITDMNLTTYVEANFTVTSSMNKNVVLSRGVTVSGRVTRSDTSEPVVNAFVFYFDKVTREGYGSPTDIDGNYNVVLPKGTYALNVQPPVGSSLTRPIDLVINVSGDMVKDIVLSPGITLSGRITRSDTNEPVIGANVGIVDIGTLEGFGTYTDLNGEYNLGVLPGSYVFHADLPESELIPYDEFSFVITQSQVKNVTLGTGVIVSGTVTRGDTGAPVDGALIHLVNSTKKASVQSGFTTHTDSNGKYGIAVFPGEYIFTVNPQQASDLDLEQGFKIIEVSGSTINNVILDAGFTVSGRVTREDTGEPVAWALAAVFDRATQKGAGSPTDLNGEYRFSVKAGKYEFFVEPPRNSGLVSTMHTLQIGSSLVKDVSLSGGFTVSGTVRRSDTSEPVAGAFVGLNNQSSGLFFGSQTDENGSYIIGAPAGSYFFVVAPPEDSDLAMHIEMEKGRGVFEVTGNTVKNVNLSPGVTLEGTVMRSDTSEPVSGARVGVFNQETGRGAGDETTGNGRYSFSITPGTYQFHVEPPQGSGLTSHNEFEVVIENNSLKNITLSMGITVSGRITRSDTSEPVAGAMIGMFNPQTRKGSGTESDANGEYSFAVEAGTYNMHVEAPEGSGLASHDERDVVVNADITRDISLTKGITVSGKVTRSDTSEPVAGALIGMFDPQTRKGTGTESDANGEYSFAVEAGTYNIHVEAPGGSGLASYDDQDIVVAADITKDISLSKGITVSGKVTRSDTSEPVAGARIGMFNPQTRKGTGTESDANGEYSFAVEAGIYNMHVDPPEGSGLASYDERDVVVNADITKDISLTKGITVSGKVTRSDTGEPVAGAQIGMFDPQTRKGTGTESDANGEYSFSVEAGTYNMHVEAPEGSSLASYDEQDVVVSADITKDISLTKGITVSGKVTRSDTSEPVAGAQIGLLNPVIGKGTGTESDANGEYSFAIEAGTYNLHVEAPQGSGLASYEEQDVVVSADMTKDIVLQVGTAGYPYPSPTGTYPSPSPTGTYPYPSPTGTYPSPSPTGTYPYPSPTGTYPSPSPTGTYPYPSPTGTYPSPSPTGTYPYPSPTGTYPYPTPTVSPVIQEIVKMKSFMQSVSAQVVGQPTITISSPFNGQTFTSANITVLGTSSSSAGVSKVEVRVGNGSYALATGTVSWSANVTLSPGSNTITVRVTDLNFSISTESVTVTYSQFALPSVTISSPLDGQIVTSVNITVLGAASSSAGVSKVEVRVGNGSYILATGTASWSASVALSPGSNTITARVTDINNNINTASVTVTYSQFTLPSITISSPFNGQSFADANITLVGTASSSSAAVSKVEVKVGNGSYTLASGTALWSAAATLNQGTNTITARVTDTNGNTNTASVVAFYSTALKGDVNSDGTVTIVDALFVAQYTVGLRSTLPSIESADVNNDGQVTVVDALFIAQYTVGLRAL